MVQKRQRPVTKRDLAGLATKKDLQKAMLPMASKRDMQRAVEQLEGRVDAKLLGLEERVDAKIDVKLEVLKEEIKRYFQVTAENLVYDFRGVFKDRLEQHDDRLTRLEDHVGLIR